MVGEVVVSLVGGEAVAVLVDGPVVLGGVGVPGADVLGLKVLQLTVDIVPLAHLLVEALSFRKMSKIFCLFDFDKRLTINNNNAPAGRDLLLFASVQR